MAKKGIVNFNSSIFIVDETIDTVLSKQGEGIINFNPMAISQCNPIDAKPSGEETLTLNMSLPAGQYVRIEWGDGNTTDITGPVSEQDYSNTYAAAGTYPILFYGDFQFLTRFKIDTVNVDGTLERIGVLSGLTFFYCYGPNTISGDVASLPTGLTYLYCRGSNTISGDITNLPTGLTYLYCHGSNTISGDIANLSTGLTFFNCIGSNTISGDVASLPAGLTYFCCIGSNTISDYTTPHTWTSKPETFILTPVGVGGLSTAEIDNLLIDFDADLTWAVGNVITLTGTNAVRSAASDAAVASITGEGATITTN